ncbi:MAG TPA: hypothetical protein VKB27_04310 [Gammaproteobacteria bacterium]|nr:hypothetical protein [Gammaproteobacteria bacterium]
MKSRYLGLALAALLAWLAGLPAQAYHQIAGGPIVVNGQELSSEQGQALLQLYGPIPAGNYWYDRYSGLWGPAGGPSTGQILPDLDIGGRMRADASGSGTGVFVNGRELHPLEVERLLQLYGSVTPGRYWMNAQLVGGFEGEPASFDLHAAAAATGGGYGGGQGSGYNRNTIGGGLMSDGNCSGYLHPGGATVMIGDC